MKLAIAIPTFNRVNRLQVAIESIRGQVLGSDFEVELVLSNSASTDGTAEFLAQLPGLMPEIKLHIWNTFTGGTSADNFNNLVRCMPEDIDWVWWLGDDDYFLDPAAVSKVIGQLRRPEHADVAFVHACQARRASAAPALYRGSCWELCNRFGLHELLGWMSSIVVRRSIFCDAIPAAYPVDRSLSTVSAFAHSTAFLERLLHLPALYIDEPLVEPQDISQTEESIQRWAVENVGQRYFLLLDDLRNMFDRGILPGGCTRVFFRYLTYSIWDRLAVQLIGQAITQQAIDDQVVADFRRLEGLSPLLADPGDRKTYRAWLTSLGAELTEFGAAALALERKKKALIKQAECLQEPIYDFKVTISAV